MNEPKRTDRFLRESFPLISSYLHSENVSLDEWRSRAESEIDEHGVFGKIIRIRHSIACAKRLFPILRAIESSPSSLSVLERRQSRGAIIGRLDIPAYLARRTSALSWPKTYPVIVNKKSLQTPENTLAKSALTSIIQELSSAHLPSKTAERIECRTLVSQLHARSQSFPWRGLESRRNLHRLLLETQNRIQRRQTGNDNAYEQLCQWTQEWKAYPGAAADSHDISIEGLMAFPIDDFFYERVFEVWVIQVAAKVLEQLGASLETGPLSLQERKRSPIYEFQLEGKRIELWFQKAFPPNKAIWKYDHSNRSLGGTPDVVIKAEDRVPMTIDAKFRLAQTQTRSEETYKMLGYLENFRPLFGSSEFHCCLVFLSYDDLNTTLHNSTSTGRITLTAAHPSDPGQCRLAHNLGNAIRSWFGMS